MPINTQIVLISQRYFQIQMAKKKIQKAPKSNKKRDEESHQDEEEVLDAKIEEPKKADKKIQTDSLFTQSFTNKIDQFKNFYTDFIKVKGTEEQGEYQKVINAVASDMEKACSKVLEKDLVDAGAWIKEKIAEIENQIKATEEAVENTRTALSQAGTFSGAEIEAQLNIIRQKGKQLEQNLEEFEGFQKRAEDISRAEENRIEEE